MAGCDQFMIDGFLGRAQMAGEASLAALHQIARVIKPQLERLLVLPSARGVWTKPRRRRTVAVLAADAVSEIERAGALLGRNVQRMTSQTTRRCIGAGQAHDLRDAHSPRVGMVDERGAMLFAHPP